MWVPEHEEAGLSFTLMVAGTQGVTRLFSKLVSILGFQFHQKSDF